MTEPFLSYLGKEIEGLKVKGLYKREREMSSPQQAIVATGGRQALNL